MKTKRFTILAVAFMAFALLVSTSAILAADAEKAIRVGKKGDVTFDQETRVGDITLKPGHYVVEHRAEGEKHFVHFHAFTKDNPYTLWGSGRGVPKAHAGEVECKLERLPAKPTTTTVYLDTEGGVQRVTKIVVAGESVAHVF